MQRCGPSIEGCLSSRAELPAIWQALLKDYLTDSENLSVAVDAQDSKPGIMQRKRPEEDSSIAVARQCFVRYRVFLTYHFLGQLCPFLRCRPEEWTLRKCLSAAVVAKFLMVTWTSKSSLSVELLLSLTGHPSSVLIWYCDDIDYLEASCRLFLVATSQGCKDSLSLTYLATELFSWSHVQCLSLSRYSCCHTLASD